MLKNTTSHKRSEAIRREALSTIQSMSSRPQDLILTKPELARHLRVSVRTIENMMAQRIIPFIRASKRSVRYHLPRVLAALERREVQEVGR